MRRVFHVNNNVEVRLLSQYLSSTYEPLTNLTATIDEVGIGYGQLLVLEAMNTDGTWPWQSRSDTLSTDICS